MLFIDDVHPKSREATDIVPVQISYEKIIYAVSDKCQNIVEKANNNSYVTLDQEVIFVQPEYIILESEMWEYAQQIVEILQGLPRRKRYKFREWKWGFCSNQKNIDNANTPTCIGYDLGLTYFKDKILKHTWGINILSSVYEEQQDGVKKIYQKVNPDFYLEQIYY